MKKTAAKWTVSILTASLLLSACGNNGGSSGTSCSGSETGGKYDEHMVISFALVGQNESVDYNGDDLAHAFTDKFNYEFESINLTWDNWKEKCNIWINSNDMPDMLQWDFNYAEYVNYVDQELFYKFPDNWEERWPNLAKVNRVAGLQDYLDEKVGGTYFLAKPVYFSAPTDPIITHNSVYIRSDWAKDAGIEVKSAYTVEELMDYARAIKSADLAGNGRTIPLDGTSDELMWIFMEQANVNFRTFYPDSDGVYHWGPAEEGTLEGLKLWKQAYEDGLLNKDFYVDGIMPSDNFDNGISGARYGSCTAHIINLAFDSFKKGCGKDPLSSIGVAHMLGDDGNYHTTEIKNFWTGTVLSPKLSDSKYERIMDIMDFSASDEGQDLTRLGFEGVDYKKDANGEVTILRDKTEDGNFILLSDKYPSLLSLYNNLTVLPDDFAMRDPSVAPERLQVINDMFASKDKLGIQKGTVQNYDWNYSFFTSPAKEKFALDYADEFAQLVLMDGDLETNWKNWCSQNETIVNTILGELNQK